MGNISQRIYNGCWSQTGPENMLSVVSLSVVELTEDETRRVHAVAAYLQLDYLHGQKEIFWYILRGIHFPCDYDDIFAWGTLHNETTKCSRRINSATLGKRY